MLISLEKKIRRFRVGQYLLLSLAVVFGFVVKTRNFLYDYKLLPVFKSSLPIISIGNVTAGGNAKTPLAIFIANELKKKGFCPVVLSRGYGGTEPGPKQIGPYDDPYQVGDEPVLLARVGNFPVVVARNRIDGVRYIEGQNIGDLIILDDGFQHRKLSRDLDIVSVDISSESSILAFFKGLLLPAGRFREPRDIALSRVDMLVFADRRPLRSTRELDPRLLSVISSKVQLYRTSIEVIGFYNMQSGEKNDEILSAIALCGIANPHGFLETLKFLNVDIVESRLYQDHYKFRAEELAELLQTYPGVPVVCTEKDQVKIERLNIALDRFWVLKTCTVVHPNDAFIVQILKHLQDVDRRKSPKSCDLSSKELTSEEN